MEEHEQNDRDFLSSTQLIPNENYIYECSEDETLDDEELARKHRNCFYEQYDILLESMDMTIRNSMVVACVARKTNPKIAAKARKYAENLSALSALIKSEPPEKQFLLAERLNNYVINKSV